MRWTFCIGIWKYNSFKKIGEAEEELINAGEKIDTEQDKEYED